MKPSRKKMLSTAAMLASWGLEPEIIAVAFSEAMTPEEYSRLVDAFEAERAAQVPPKDRKARS
jgi:hypothetical protein